MPFSSDRRFRLWEYNVSHDQLLIRSPRSSELDTNIDLVFWNVHYFAIPTWFDGIVLDHATLKEIQSTSSATRPTHDVFSLACAGSRHIIIAGGFKVLRNKLDISDSSLEHFRSDDLVVDLGEILAHS